MLIAGVFVLSGCGNSNETGKEKESIKTEATIDGVKFNFNNEKTFHNLKFKYPENAKFTTEEEESNAMKIFKDNSEDKLLASTVITYRKDKNVEEYIKKMHDVDVNDLKSETINNTKWYIYDYNNKKAKAQVYYCQNNQDVYVISFPQEDNQDIDIENYKTVFMNNAKFE